MFQQNSECKLKFHQKRPIFPNSKSAILHFSSVISYLEIKFDELSHEQLVLNFSSLCESLSKIQFVAAEKTSKKYVTFSIVTHDTQRESADNLLHCI
jgi:hypothetical protein